MKEDTGSDMAIFIAAIKLPPKDRPRFLDRACGDDENLRRKVEALLNAHDRIGDFLEKPPTGGAIE